MFLQIFDKIKKDIISAKYPPNTQIPTVRQLACDMSVNPNTVQKALQLLEDEGLIITRGTLGKFVTSDTDLISRVKKQLQKETLRAWIAEMRDIGITTEGIIEFINSEGGNV
jgi:DNA-binding transcriptional regulator YhcF (GntR family)